MGVAGFLVDWAVVHLLMGAGANFFLARAVSYFCAASSTWLLNRIWTFEANGRPALQQWISFLLANSVGGFINYSVSAMLALLFPALIASYAVIAIAAGSLSGMAINFMLSKKYVFNT